MCQQCLARRCEESNTNNSCEEEKLTFFLFTTLIFAVKLSILTLCPTTTSVLILPCFSLHLFSDGGSPSASSLSWALRSSLGLFHSWIRFTRCVQMVSVNIRSLEEEWYSNSHPPFLFRVLHENHIHREARLRAQSEQVELGKWPMRCQTFLWSLSKAVVLKLGSAGFWLLYGV